MRLVKNDYRILYMIKYSLSVLRRQNVLVAENKERVIIKQTPGKIIRTSLMISTVLNQVLNVKTLFLRLLFRLAVFQQASVIITAVLYYLLSTKFFDSFLRLVVINAKSFLGCNYAWCNFIRVYLGFFDDLVHLRSCSCEVKNFNVFLGFSYIMKNRA